MLDSIGSKLADGDKVVVAAPGTLGSSNIIRGKIEKIIDSDDEFETAAYVTFEQGGRVTRRFQRHSILKINW